MQAITSMIAVSLTHLGFVCSLGNSLADITAALKKGNFRPLSVSDGIPGRTVPYGMADTQNASQIMRCYDLADIAYDQIAENVAVLKDRYPPHRLGVIIGASNTGIHEAQRHITSWMKTGECPPEFSFQQIELGSPSSYLKEKSGFKGPAYTVSTACSSSAKVFRSARDLLKNDICDAVLVGGVDARCDFALNGFNALAAVSSNPTLPMSANRDGINLGEGAALFIMERGEKKGIMLTGIGENSDAYHQTQPDPSGNGAVGAMKSALDDAEINADDIDYINLHGTGTAAGDAMESVAVNRIFGEKKLCASTKPLTGHTLGAAGAIEAALSWIMLQNNIVIPHLYDGGYDPAFPPLCLATGAEKIDLRRIISNSFAFGGSNASIVLEKY